MPASKRIRTVLYGDQRFSKFELELIHTPALQRLYELKQLGMTDRVFVDASHSRLHHVLGVMQQVENLMSALQRNLLKDGNRDLSFQCKGATLSVACRDMASYVCRRKSAARLMGLLHDLTHAPFGHTLEDEIQLVQEKHDEPKRQADAFYRLLVQYLGWHQRDLDETAWGSAIGARDKKASPTQQLAEYLDAPQLLAPPEDDAFITELIRIGSVLLRGDGHSKAPLSTEVSALRRFFKELAFAMRALLHLDLVHKRKPKPKSIPAEKYSFDRVLNGILDSIGDPLNDDEEFNPQRDAFLLDVIGNTICADLLDYAKRDSFFAGMKLDYDAERIVENFTLVRHWNPRHTIKATRRGRQVLHEDPFGGHSLRTAISLFSHKLRIDVPGELLNLLQVRFYVYERMLFHPTKCVAGAMIGAALQLLGWKNLPPHMRFVGDSVFLYEVSEAARLVRNLIATVDSQQRFDDAVVAKLEKLLEVAPTTGVLIAAKQLIRDLLPDSREVVRQLDTRKRLIHAGNDGAAGIRAAARVEELLRERGRSRFDASILDTIDDTLKGETAEVRKAARALLEMPLRTCGQVLADLTAGLRLLDRLATRRYHRSIFRLLPNVSVGTLDDVRARNIADLFLNASVRMIAEREIERRSGLPVGSIVIHCPVSVGPRKIANILITDGGDETKTARLRDIEKLDEPIFGKHQRAIRALETMYESMWRLVVSVAPPHHAKWKEINPHIGAVLYEILSNGATGAAVENDKYMVRELDGQSGRTARAAVAHVKITQPDGEEEFMPVIAFQFLKGAGEKFRKSRLFDAVLQEEPVHQRVAAFSPTRDQGMDSVDANLRLLDKILDGAKKPGLAAEMDQPPLPGITGDAPTST